MRKEAKDRCLYQIKRIYYTCITENSTLKNRNLHTLVYNVSLLVI